MPTSILVRAGRGSRPGVAVRAAPVVIAVLALWAPAAGAAVGLTERVSVSSSGDQGYYPHLPIRSAAISADGRFVAFPSGSSKMVAGDTNGVEDVFVRDRRTSSTERVSVGSDGGQGDCFSRAPAISGDGRFVAFSSCAYNLAGARDTGGVWDVFVHDRQTGSTERVSVASDGARANDHSDLPAISADGRFVAFTSVASNLVAGDTIHSWDVFVHDRQTHRTELVNVSSDGFHLGGSSGRPAISADGRFIAFQSSAENLVAGDTNHTGDVFVRDRRTASIERVSVASDGTQAARGAGGGAISADGRFVVFSSADRDLVVGDTNEATDVFVRDRQTARTERVSVGSDGQASTGTPPTDVGSWHAISADGRFVAFAASAKLVADDTNEAADVFVRDRQTASTERVSVASDGAQANHGSDNPAISADGRFVAFPSWASNLVAGDTNGVRDVFVRDRTVADDWIAPNVSGPSFPFASPFPPDADLPVRIRVSWATSDPSGICETELEQSVDGGAFTAVALPRATADTIVREHDLGHHYQYRVRASDCAGNRSPWKTTKPRVAAAEDAQPGRITYTPDWAQLSEPGHFEATLTGSRTAGARATYTISARRIAWIAPRGPDGGSARVSVDGVAVATVDLSATSPRPRRVVWQKAWTSATDHTIQIEILSGRIDIDAFAVLR